MKKWLWVCKNHTIVRVVTSKKTHAAWGNRVRKNIDFSFEIEPKSKKKSRKTAIAAKIDKNALLGSRFLAKNRFRSDFRAPAGRHFELSVVKTTIAERTLRSRKCALMTEACRGVSRRPPWPILSPILATPGTLRKRFSKDFRWLLCDSLEQKLIAKSITAC